MDTEATLNPYAAPALTEVSSPHQPLYYRHDKFLFFRDGAALPSRCIRTNDEVGPEGWRKRKTITWTPQWILVFILAGFLPFLILSVVLQKKGKIGYSLSKEARKDLWGKRLIFLGLAVVGFFAMISGPSIFDNDAWNVYLLMGGFVAILVGLFGSLTVSPLSVKGERDGWFKVRGCSKEFLDSLGQSHHLGF